jgi:hypothetical protein
MHIRKIQNTLLSLRMPRKRKDGRKTRLICGLAAERISGARNAIVHERLSMHQRIRLDFVFVFAILMVWAQRPAQAGTIAKGEWAPASCGARPQTPTLDLRNADAYNRSVDVVNTYKQAIRQYLDCLLTEANADIQTVTRSANEAQRVAKEANEKIQADVKQAEDKLK